MKLEEALSITDKKARAEALSSVLNSQPPGSWVKKHPYGGFDYLPIDKVEYILTSIFKNWYVEVIGYSQILNSVCCHVRLYYMDLEHYEATGSVLYRHQDGVGADGLQVDSGSRASDISSIKQNSVAMSLPKAEVAAIKCAAEKIGRVFGRDLNRRDLMSYALTEEKEQKFKNLIK